LGRATCFIAPARLIGRRQDNGDCLFALEDGRVAYVRLAWRDGQEENPRLPAAMAYGLLEQWTERVMPADSREW